MEAFMMASKLFDKILCGGSLFLREYVILAPLCII